MLKSNFTKLLLVVIIIAHLFILTKLIFFPYPELFIYPYLTNNGLIPYKQILDQHFPGLIFLPINFDNLGMNNPQIARWWLIASVVAVQVLLFFISRKLLKSDKKALIAAFLYLLWQPFFEGWVLWIDSFLALMLLPAFYFVYHKKSFLSGLLLGVAIVFKQVMIPLAALLFIYWIWQKESIKQLGIYLFGLILPIGGMFIYLLLIGSLADFWYWTIVFNLTIYAQSGRGLVPTLAHLLRVAFVFGSSFIIFLRIKEQEAQILLLFLIGTLIGLSTRFDFVHFQPALPFAILAIVYTVERIWKLVPVKISIAVYLLVSIWWLTIFYKGHIGERIYFFDEHTINVADKIDQYTKDGEKIFIFGEAPHLYQMTKTMPAGDLFVFQFPWFFDVAQERMLEGLKKDQPNIIVADRTVKIEDQPITEFGKKINLYINNNYEKIEMIGQTEILRKK